MEPERPATAEKSAGSKARARGLSSVCVCARACVLPCVHYLYQRPDDFYCFFFCIAAEQTSPSRCCSIILQFIGAHVKSGSAHHVTDGRPRGIVHRYTCCKNSQVAHRSEAAETSRTSQKNSTMQQAPAEGLPSGKLT